MDNKYYFFYGGKFSNFYLTPIRYDGNDFNCSEQLFMWLKAVLFDDQNVANQILQEKVPNKQKALGRKIKGFIDDIWNQHKVDFMCVANLCKYSQNPTILNDLVNTKPKVLVEASPTDTIWGIGLSAKDPRALDESQWRGKNLLGKVLTHIRDQYIEGCRIT